jgi:uncharacterized protein DUF3263
VARYLNRPVGGATLRPVSETPPDGVTRDGTLDERARAILDFEREAWKLTVPKERAIRARFGFSAARYHQLLTRTIDRPEAVAYDPMLVRRLRRLREVRRRRRVARDLGVHV